MRKYLIFIILLVSSCSLMSERQDWDFVQAAGGILIANQNKDSNWLVLCGDVSGLQMFSNKPTQTNSALALKSVNISQENNELNLYITTTLVSKKYHSTEIQGVNISEIKSGKYIVNYINKDGSKVKIGNVRILK